MWVRASIPSTLNPRETPYVVISRETKRFVDEIHDHKKEFRSSKELLTAFQSEGKEPCMEEGGSNRTKEPYAPEGNKETCANPLSSLLNDSLFFLRVKGKWITIDANPSRGGSLSTQVSKILTKMTRHHDQDEREQDGSYHWDTVRSVLLKAFAQNGAG